MKRLILIAILFAGVFQAQAASVAWQTNAPVFRADASPTNPPTLIYFTATWCGYCKVMDRTAFADPAVVSAVGRQQAVKLDLDANPELATKLKVSGVPAFLLVNDRGEEISRTVGASEVGEFLKWLETAPALAAKKAEADAKQDAAFAELKRRFDEAGANPPAQLIATMLQVAARGQGPARSFGLARLEELAKKSPDPLFAGLEHEDLACRVAALSILQRALGREIEVDVWDSAEARREAVRRVRQSPTR